MIGPKDTHEGDVEEPVEATLEVEEEPAAEEPKAEAAPPKAADPRELRIKFLEAQLVERESTLHAYIKAHKKAEAEFEAYKTRQARDKQRAIDQASGKVVARLLDVSDNLERTLQAAQQGGSVEQLTDGVALVSKQFLERLSEMGLERFDPIGQPFDPTTMEALGLVPVSDPAQDNVVMVTLQVGFRLGDQELRPARVQVGKKS